MALFNFKKKENSLASGNDRLGFVKRQMSCLELNKGCWKVAKGAAQGTHVPLCPGDVVDSSCTIGGRP